MEQSRSLVFDRAVDYYDRTRGLSEATMEHIVRTISPELVGRGSCLEIGIGTGRIALPLAGAGVELLGVDLSRPMLEKLLEKRPTAEHIPVVQADATALPFAEASFGGALAVHVFHLIPQWQSAALELVRVVRSGGVVLVDLGGAGAPAAGQGPGAGREIHDYFSSRAGISSRHRGANEPAEVDDLMSSVGATMRALEPITETKETTYEEVIAHLESGIFSFTWSASEEERKGAGAATRAWARERFGPLEQSYTSEWTVAYRAYDLP
jgi:ubiquinone/menaquinone biosynthesis C-methylase UbiE